MARQLRNSRLPGCDQANSQYVPRDNHINGVGVRLYVLQRAERSQTTGHNAPAAAAAVAATAASEAVGPALVLHRRQLLEAAACTALTASSPLMLPAAALAGPVPTVRYLDPQGAFRLQVPQGWQQVNLLPGTGILASWYDPANRGSDTLAVYAAPTDAASTHDLGTAREVGEALASISPGGSLQQWGSDRRSNGREYITTQVRFTGVSAGLFGSVIDIRCSVVAEGQKFTLRISSKADNIEGNTGWYQTINRIMESFQVLV